MRTAINQPNTDMPARVISLQNGRKAMAENAIKPIRYQRSPVGILKKLDMILPLPQQSDSSTPLI